MSDRLERTIQEIYHEENLDEAIFMLRCKQKEIDRLRDEVEAKKKFSEYFPDEPTPFCGVDRLRANQIPGRCGECEYWTDLNHGFGKCKHRLKYTFYDRGLFEKWNVTVCQECGCSWRFRSE